jgi:hypothetical protein
MTCPLCGSRKAKRACPALGRSICTVCCGTKRLAEIRCPDDCSYLSSSRTHPAAVVQRRQEKDLRFLLPLIADLAEPQYRLMLFLQSVVLKHSAAAVPSLLDEDVAAAANAVAATLETAGKGIIYQHQATSLPAQHLVTSIEAALRELTANAGSHAAALERDAAVALRRIGTAAEQAAKALPDDERPVFLRLLGRMMSVAATPAERGQPGAASSPGGLIIPG